MTETEAILTERHGPAIPLEAVCGIYFGIASYKEACRKAALNLLPVPTFKLRDSERSPYLIYAKDLAAWIDSKALSARQDWQHCQVDGPVSWLNQPNWQRQAAKQNHEPQDAPSWLIQASELDAIVGRGSRK